jgi:hypothetical protein
MNKTPVIGAGTDFTISSNGYIASFITDAGDPALLNIPAGNWDFEVYFQSSTNTGTPSFYVELYKYDGTTFTLIASSSTNPKFITSGTNTDAYYTPLAVPSTTLTVTDRLAVRIYVNNSGNTITLHTEDNNLCQIITTFSTGINALNGLTSQVQYFATGTSGTDFNISSLTDTHTFNLPVASATNTGKLSSSNWSTFNSKISPSDTASMLAPYLRKADTTAMLANYVNNVGYGLSKAGQVVSADSATLANYFLRRKDSLTSTNLLGYVTRTILADTAAAIRSADAGGTVTSIATNNGTGITGGTITTAGTLAIDTVVISTRAWRQKGVDSLQANINLKLNISDTASMLNPYLRKIDTASLSNRINTKLNISDTSSMLTNYINNVGYGLSKVSQVVSADSATLASYFLRRKDSLTATNLLGYVTRTVLADSAAAIRAAAGAGTVTGSGTATEVAFWNGTSSLSSSSNLYWDNSNSRLGINNSTPTYPLTVNGSVMSTAENAYYWTKPSSPSSDIYSLSANSSGAYIYNHTTANTLAFFAEGGNVGIGTVTPDSMLTVTNGARFERGVRMSGLPTGVGTKAVRIDANGTLSVADTTTGGISGSGTTNYIPKFTSSSAIGNSQVFDNGTNVGIGTTSPAALLHVSQASANTIFRLGNNTTYDQFIYFNGNNDWSLGMDYSNSNAFVLSNASSLGTNDRLVITTGGNVGIGTTSPNAKLQVLGTIKVATGNAQGILGLGEANGATVNVGIWRGAANAPTSDGNFLNLGGYDGMVFAVSAAAIGSQTERMRITSGGSVGIGTTSPLGNLDVSTSGNTAINITAGSTALSRLIFGTTSGNSRGFIDYDNTSSVRAMIFRTNESERMRITSGGNIGIGTTTIGSTLQVNGNAAIGYSASTAAPTNGLAVSGNVGIGNTNSAGTFKVDITGSSRIINLSTAGASDIGLQIESTVASYQAASKITFKTPTKTIDFGLLGTSNSSYPNMMYIYDGTAFRWLMNANGQFGFGTGTIGSLVQINGNAAIGYSASTAAPTNGLAVAGNVAIGTNTALAALHVQGTTLSNIAMYSSSDALDQKLWMFQYGTSVGAGTFRLRAINDANTTGNNALIITRSGTTLSNMQLMPDGGNVGIGTSTIGSRLQVNGNAAIGYSASTAAPSNGLAVSGDVSIGTNTANSKLHVAGSLRLPITTKTATYTLDATDYTVVFDLNGNATANLPDATTIPGRIYVIKINRTSVTDTLTIDPNGAQTIDGNATIAIQCQYAVTIQSDGTNWRIIGDYAQGLNCL